MRLISPIQGLKYTFLRDFCDCGQRAEIREQGSESREQGAGNREQGTGNREQRTENREQRTEIRDQGKTLGHSEFLVRRELRRPALSSAIFGPCYAFGYGPFLCE